MAPPGGLEVVAVEQARQGFLDDAMASVARIWDLETRTKALAGIARTLVRRGEVDEGGEDHRHDPVERSAPGAG